MKKWFERVAILLAFVSLLPLWTVAQEDAAYRAMINRTFLPTFGYVDKDGKSVINFKYTDAKNFSNGLAPVQTLVRANERWGFIDKIIPLTYNKAGIFSEGLARVNVNKKWGYVDTAGNEVIAPKYERARVFINGYAKVRLARKWLIIDREGIEREAGNEGGDEDDD